MAKTYRITLAGKDYSLKYGFKERRFIEKTINPDKDQRQRSALTAATGGIVEENATVLLAGIRHEDSSLSVDDVIDLMEAHIELGGDFYADVYRKVVLRAFLESKVCGPFKPETVDEWCGKWEGDKPATVRPQ